MAKSNSIGYLRAQSAYVDSDSKIVLKTKDVELERLLQRVVIVRTYPDTQDGQGNWSSVFVIEVARE